MYGGLWTLCGQIERVQAVKDDAREYWDAAELYERANGRLYVGADFALPRDLDTEDHVALAHA